MGVPILSTLLIFLVYQILLFGSTKGLPFASISSMSLLKTPESPVTSSAASNLASTDNFLSSSSVPGPLSSKNFKLFIGSPNVNTILLPSQNPSIYNSANSNAISSAEPSNINVLSSLNIQNKVVPSNPDTVTRSSIDTDSNVHSYQTSTPTLASELSIVPTLNKDLNSDNFKRELRDTISVLTQDSDTVPIKSSSLANISPCTTSFINNFPSSPGNSNAVTFNSLYNRNYQQSCVANKLNFQQDSSPACSCESSEVINIDHQYTNLPSIAPANTLSSFTALKNYINSRQNLQSCSNSENTQNQPIVETNAPGQINQVNNNLMFAQALLNNKIVPQQLSSQTLINNQPNNVEDRQNNNDDCDNKVDPYNKLLAEYQNVLRIRNNVIPQMLSNNVLVKNIPQNTVKDNNDYSSGCPQLQTIPIDNNVPFIQNNNLVLNPINNCCFANNNQGSTGISISVNNIARTVKDSLNEKNSNCATQSNNQGCPQLLSIPIYNKESLLNKQLIHLSSNNNECSQNQNDNVDLTLTLQNNNVDLNNNNNGLTLNTNNDGCPQLLTLAKNNLYALNNNGASINVIRNTQNCDYLDEVSENVNLNNNYNCIQIPTTNDNLAQALKLINLAKSNQQSQISEATINILPYGQTLLDGKPICNNLVSMDSVPGPNQLSTSTDSCNPNNFLTIQELSSIPFLSTPVNPFSCCIPSDTSINIPTNIMLAPPFSHINTVSPLTTNIVPSVINVAPSVPNIASITATESTIVNQPFASMGSCCNNNILPMLALLDTNYPLVSSNSIPVQTLPQVSFINNIPSSTLGVTPTISLSDSCISLSNLPPVCTSIQPISSSYISPLITANVPQENRVAEVFPCLNNIVSSFTQNILSTLMTKTLPSTGVPLAKLPPVNPSSSSLVPESSSVNSPICLDISAPRVSLQNIPVVCNEYLPPLYNSAIIPVTTFNSDLFTMQPDTILNSCSPFTLSKTDAYYPEISFTIPTVGSSDCSSLCGPLFMPASSLPQSSSVLKLNNTGREAKGFEELVKSLIL